MQRWQQQQMTHERPIQSERPLADWLGSMNAMQKLGLLQVPVVSDVAGLLGDIQQYRDEPESRNLLNYSMTGLGLLPMIPAMTVFHGSPHKWLPEEGFPMGRPRLDKIGMGEGNTSYGWGWYSSQEPSVAATYANKLGLPEVKVGGQNIDVTKNSPDSVIAARLAHALRDWETAKASGYGANIDAQAKMLASVERELEEGMRLAARSENFDLFQDLADQQAALGRMKSAGLEVAPTGTMYTLDLPDERIPGLLDWDKPLSQQPENVRKALQKHGYSDAPTEMFEPIPGAEYSALLKQRFGTDDFEKIPRERWSEAQDLALRKVVKSPEWTGKGIFEDLAGGDSNYSEDAAQKLRELGIPGLRYLDAGSRGAGNGTSNFVVWDQALLDEMARRMANMASKK